MVPLKHYFQGTTYQYFTEHHMHSMVIRYVHQLFFIRERGSYFEGAGCKQGTRYPFLLMFCAYARCVYVPYDTRSAVCSFVLRTCVGSVRFLVPLDCFVCTRMQRRPRNPSIQRALAKGPRLYGTIPYQLKVHRKRNLYGSSSILIQLQK